MAHFSFAWLFQIGLLFVLICWAKESTGAAFSLEEEFKQLKENYIQLKEIVKNFESKVTELEAKDVEMQDKIAQQDSLLSDLLREKNERTAAAAANFESAPMRTSQSAVAINGLPTSCADLKMIGHIWSGIYSIAGSAMMESVYCDFSKLPSDPDFQKWIGYNDVKSVPAHFYVQRNSSFASTGTPIPFDLERVNEGNAMNLTSGIFTAPRPGTYFFSFTGHAKFPESSFNQYLQVFLFLRNPFSSSERIGSGWIEGLSTGSNSLTTPLTLQSTLNLKQGDQVWVEIWDISFDSYLVENAGASDHPTHFTGWMLDEDIVASL